MVSHEVSVYLTPEQLGYVDDYKDDNGLDSRSAAIRQLAGLEEVD